MIPVPWDRLLEKQEEHTRCSSPSAWPDLSGPRESPPRRMRRRHRSGARQPTRHGKSSLVPKTMHFHFPLPRRRTHPLLTVPPDPAARKGKSAPCHQVQRPFYSCRESAKGLQKWRNTRASAKCRECYPLPVVD